MDKANKSKPPATSGSAATNPEDMQLQDSPTFDETKSDRLNLNRKKQEKVKKEGTKKEHDSQGDTKDDHGVQKSKDKKVRD